MTDADLWLAGKAAAGRDDHLTQSVISMDAQMNKGGQTRERLLLLEGVTHLDV